MVVTDFMIEKIDNKMDASLSERLDVKWQTVMRERIDSQSIPYTLLDEISYKIIDFLLEHKIRIDRYSDFLMPIEALKKAGQACDLNIFDKIDVHFDAIQDSRVLVVGHFKKKKFLIVGWGREEITMPLLVTDFRRKAKKHIIFNLPKIYERCLAKCRKYESLMRGEDWEYEYIDYYLNNGVWEGDILDERID